METIRCPRCQKLLRADARKCGRCGLTIPKGMAPRRRIIGEVHDLGQPTSPQASPHGAGHYLGLHPEDQPFQSSFFQRIQRPLQPEPLEIDDSTQLDMQADELPAEAEMSAQLDWQDVEEEEPPTYPARPPHEHVPADESPVPPIYPARSPRGLIYEYEEDAHTPAFSALADFPTLPIRRSPRTPLPETPIPPVSRQSAHNPHIVRLMIRASLICFLIATSLLALLLLLNKNQGQAQAPQPRLIALPGEVRVGDVLQLTGSGFDIHHVVALTRDTGLKLLDAQGKELLPATDARGSFQIHIPITSAWSTGVHTLQASEGRIRTTTSLTIQAPVGGEPRLQLGISRIDLGAGNPGTLSQKTMTLTNAGGGRVTWSARSTVAWLSLSPTHGNFAGNAVVELAVNRANLAPQAYLGQIIFTQSQGATQTFTVSMTVNTLPADLMLSTASLAFAGTPAQSPAGQTMVIQNDGGQALNWSAGSTTSDGGAWLSVTPASGLLGAHTSAILTVNVATLNMTLGVYQGALNFSYAGGLVQQVAITLNVNPPPQPAMHLSRQTLSFTTNQGFGPPPQSFTIANTGNAPLNWAIHADANGQAYLLLSATSGSLAAGQSVQISVSPRLGSTGGSIKSTLTVVDSDTGTTVPNQQVDVSIAITSQAVISLTTPSLKFEHSGVTTDTSTLLIFSNSGSLPLHWSLVESAQVPWLSFDVTSGTLAAGGKAYINVRCLNGQLQPGTYTVTLTLKDTDPGTVVAPQSVPVTLIISA